MSVSRRCPTACSTGTVQLLRRFTILIFIAAGVFLPLQRKIAVAADAPNIVFILADDLGYGDLRCYNDRAKVATPHLDQLARQGVRFTDAHSPSTVCTPSRYSLLTGTMAFRIGQGGVFIGGGGPCLIAENQFSLPRMLREQGYATAMVGKWHLGLTFHDAQGERITRGGLEGIRQIDFSRAIPDAPIHRGFDSFFGTACCPGTDTLYAFIDGDRIPTPPTKLLDKSPLPKHPYADDNRVGMIAPDYDLQELDVLFLQKSQAFLRDHAMRRPEQPFFLFHSMAAVHLPSFAGRDYRGRTQVGPHGDFLHEMDDVVGQLLQTLDDIGARDNTLVMFSSDNGPEIAAVVHMREDYDHDGARPWRGVKRDQWEGGHRVPFIARWPKKIPAGGVSSQPLCLTDVLATCAAVVGAPLPQNSAEDSFNQLPALLGTDDGRAIRPYLLHQSSNLSLAIREGRWKYLDHRGSGGNGYQKGPLLKYAVPEAAPDAPGQLYNLVEDPGETRNLYNERPEIVKRLKALLEQAKSSGRSRPL